MPQTPLAVRAVAIDLDGTMLDTIEDLSIAVNETLSELRLPRLELELVRTFVRKGLANLVQRSLRASLGREPEPAIFARAMSLYESNYDRVNGETTTIYPGVREGLVNVWSLHTTCAVFINENQSALHSDIKQFLEETVSRHGQWMHNDPEHSDCDRNNADAHLRAMLLGHSLTLQISNGDVVLGQWQRVLMAELDGPRARTLRIQVWGVA